MEQERKHEPMQLQHDHHNGDIIKQILSPISDQTTFQTVSNVFKLLDDPNRLRIFWLLCHMEECVINIAAIVQMSSPAVSHHLKQLKSGGLITSRRDGKEVYYKASDSSYSMLLDKTIENIMNISCPKNDSLSDHLPCSAEQADTYPQKYSSDQIRIIQEIHDYLMHHLDKRISIEQLAKEFLLNTTTLKALFKSAYGVSLATHINEHRMQKAATLLLETSDSILDIANKVGYESQSKFSAAFKKHFHQTPLEYRKNRKGFHDKS